MPYTKVISYGNGKHFAKVTEYNSAGTPTKVTSKWGPAELMEGVNAMITLKTLLIGILMVFITSASTASNNLFPEPINNGAPDYVTWDPETGEYINNDFYKDPISGELYDKKVKPQGYEGSKKLVSSLTQWTSSHRNSASQVDKALVKYFGDLQNYRPSSYKAYYDPKDDPYLKDIVQLGYEYLPEMLEKINTDIDVANILMFSIEEITKTNNGFIEYNKDTIKQWLGEFNNKKNKAKNISTLSSEDITSLGMLAVPFLSDKAEKGDVKALYSINSILGYGKDIDKSLALSNWKKWKVDNEKTITLIKEYIESD